MFKLAIVVYVLTVNGPIAFDGEFVASFDTEAACREAAPGILESKKTEVAARMPRGAPFVIVTACPEAAPVNPNIPGEPA